ncbi:hypothetical protein LA080_004788 [Diaporthe eres]|nr:hypothetical protein LA080_004788 [Diaporthe eres]
MESRTSTFHHGRTVVIPRQQIKKVYSLPENVLDAHNVQNESMLMEWTFPVPLLSSQPLHINVIRSQLTQNIPRVTPLVAAEIEYGFNRGWGQDSGWKEVKVWNSAIRIISGAANGAFCGSPLCRDLDFLDRVADHALFLFGGAIGVGLFPVTLRNWVGGPILSIISQAMANRVFKKSRPVVTERLEKTAKLKADPDYDWTPPEDALQWLIDECYASPNPEEQLDLKRVCYRLLIMNDVSLLTTAYTCQNLLLDLFSTDPRLGYVEALRDECARALAESGGIWDHTAVKKLRLVDSAIRESMRLNPFGSVLLPRRVVHPEGIEVSGWKARIPAGTRISLPVEPIHLDETTYPDAQKYKPFRFARDAVAERGSASPGGQKSTVKSSVTLDEDFLSFGVPGRNACPGRFFAMLETKIFIANTLLRYDVECIEARPKSVPIMWAKYPSAASIRVRRRVQG